MKKARLFALSMFLLSLNACQAPSQQLTPEASQKLNYSRQVTAAMKAYAKDSLEGLRKNPQIFSGGMGGSSQSVPSGASKMVSTFSASAQPASSSFAPPPKPPSLEEALKLLDLLKELLKVNDKVMQTTEAQIKALNPPAEMAARHAKLLDYFRIGREFCKEMLTLLEKGPSAAAEMAEFQTKFKAQMEELKALEGQALGFLYELLLASYRQDRITLQQGPALSRDAYILRMRSLIPKLPDSIKTPSRFFGEALVGGTGSGAETLAELAAMHPPEDYEESHTALYASLRLHQELAPKLKTLFASDAEAKNLTQKPIELMIKLLGDAEIYGKLMEFSTMVPKAQEATERVIRG